MKVSITYLILLFSASIFSQGFVHVDKYSSPNVEFNFLVKSITGGPDLENRIMLIGTSYDTSNSNFLFVKVLDTLGQEIYFNKSKSENNAPYSLKVENEILQLNDSSFYLYTDLFTPTNEQVVHKINDKGEISTTFIINEDNKILSNFSGQITSIDSSFFLSSNKQVENGLNAYSFMKYDGKFNLKNEVIFSHAFRSNLLTDLISLPKNEFLLLGHQSAPWNSTDIASNKSWYYIVRLDSSGNILQEIKGKGTKDGYTSNGVYYRDENGEARLAFGCANWSAEFNAYVTSPRFIIIDSIGNIKNEFDYNSYKSFYNYITKVRKVEDGFIIAGQIASEDEGQRGLINIFICKLDKNANVLWEEKFPIAWKTNEDNWFNFLTGLDIMPSGSILATGYGENNKNEFCSFLIKLDKDGCIEAGCRSVNVKDGVIDEIITYPNPNPGIFVVECLGSATLSIYDISGVKIMQKSLDKGKNDITLSDKYKGVFIVKIVQNDSIFVNKIVVD